MYAGVPLMPPSSDAVTVAACPIADRHARCMRIRSRQAEVDDARRAVAREHDVLGLDVAMHDAHRMRGREAVGDLHRQIEQPLQRQRTARQLIAQ